MVGIVKCRKPVVLSDQVYWWLCKRKVELRVKSLDEVLRIELIRFQHETGPAQYASLIGTEEGNDHGSITTDETKF